MQIPIIMKAVKNINKLIKIYFWDAMLFHFSATPSNVYCFDASLQSLNIYTIYMQSCAVYKIPVSNIALVVISVL